MTATILPLVVRCPMASRDNPALIGAATEPTLQVQMNTLGGLIYIVPLSSQAGSQCKISCQHKNGLSRPNPNRLDHNKSS